MILSELNEKVKQIRKTDNGKEISIKINDIRICILFDAYRIEKNKKPMNKAKIDTLIDDVLFLIFYKEWLSKQEILSI